MLRKSREKRKPMKRRSQELSFRLNRIPCGKLAPLAIRTDKEQYPLVQNALANKMVKYVGSKAKVTGRFVQVGDKKAMEPWLYERQDESGKKPKFKQPVEG